MNDFGVRGNLHTACVFRRAGRFGGQKPLFLKAVLFDDVFYGVDSHLQKICAGVEQQRGDIVRRKVPRVLGKLLQKLLIFRVICDARVGEGRPLRPFCFVPVGDGFVGFGVQRVQLLPDLGQFLRVKRCAVLLPPANVDFQDAAGFALPGKGA